MEIKNLSFAVVDLGLYLDTHPEDQRARSAGSLLAPARVVGAVASDKGDHTRQGRLLEL